MNRSQLEHIIRAASAISGDDEIIVIGSQSIHAQIINPPPIAFISEEADVYPRNFPERADAIDGAIGELSSFHETFGYYAQGVTPATAVLPAGWEDRLVPLKNENTRGAAGLCLNVHDLLLAKYAANREKDRAFNQAVVAHGLADQATLLELLGQMPIDEEMRRSIRSRIEGDFAAGARVA